MPKSSKRQVITDISQLYPRAIISKNGCLVWQAGKNRGNYGTIRHDGRMVAVHRLVCELEYGKPSDLMYALHSCDNPPCFNPEHLRWGTHLENMQDSKSRQRRAVRRGERNGRSKLDESKVRAIRAIYGTGPTTIEIAALYGVSNQIISRIIKGEAWSHVA